MLFRYFVLISTFIAGFLGQVPECSFSGKFTLQLYFGPTSFLLSMLCACVLGFCGAMIGLLPMHDTR